MSADSQNLSLIRSALGAPTAKPANRPRSNGLEALEYLAQQLPDAEIETPEPGEACWVIRHRAEAGECPALLTDCGGDQIRLHHAQEMYRLEAPPESLQNVAFIDSETIGLSRGAGTVAFLVGLGFWNERGDFIVEQCLIGDYASEPIMLEWFVDRLQHFTHLSSYNGKSFDLPILRSRSIMNGMRPTVWKKPHMDLLHFSRRLWRRILPSVSLGSVEQNIFAHLRTKDLPSAEIPAEWHLFAEDCSASRMGDVVAHHAQDMASLASVLSRHLKAFDDPSQLEEPQEIRGLARFYRTNKDYKREAKLLQLAAGKEKAQCPDRHLFELSITYKRCGNWQKACSIWEELTAESRTEFQHVALIELAKYYEHRQKNYHRAALLVRETVGKWELEREVRELMGKEDLGQKPPETLVDMRHRLKRLEAKLMRSALSQ